MNKNIPQKVVVLGTGGTIAGVATNAADNVGYTAGQIGVAELLAGVPMVDVPAVVIETEQLAQLDSKNMSAVVWLALLGRVRELLARADVLGVVITHGTDTLEETAYFLHVALGVQGPIAKPVVLTCAMRPATALVADGPQNLKDALAVVISGEVAGVVAVCAGTIHGAVEVQKLHPYRLDAFGSGEGGPLGFVEEGIVRLKGNRLPVPVEQGVLAINSVAICALESTMVLPRVELVTSYAGADGALVDLMVAQTASKTSNPVRGIVVAATGNGTVHQDLEAALVRARDAGIVVLRTTRCALGQIVPLTHDTTHLSPVKARIFLMLSLL